MWLRPRVASHNRMKRTAAATTAPCGRPRGTGGRRGPREGRRRSDQGVRFAFDGLGPASPARESARQLSHTRSCSATRRVTACVELTRRTSSWTRFSASTRRATSAFAATRRLPLQDPWGEQVGARTSDCPECGSPVRPSSRATIKSTQRQPAKRGLSARPPAPAAGAPRPRPTYPAEPPRPTSEARTSWSRCSRPPSCGRSRRRPPDRPRPESPDSAPAPCRRPRAS